MTFLLDVFAPAWCGFAKAFLEQGSPGGDLPKLGLQKQPLMVNGQAQLLHPFPCRGLDLNLLSKALNHVLDLKYTVLARYFSRTRLSPQHPLLRYPQLSARSPILSGGDRRLKTADGIACLLVPGRSPTLVMSQASSEVEKIHPGTQCLSPGRSNGPVHGEETWLVYQDPLNVLCDWSVCGFEIRVLAGSFGEMEEGDDAPVEENSQAETEGAASAQNGSAECDASSPPGSEEAESREASESPKESKKQEPGENLQELNPWNGPGVDGRRGRDGLLLPSPLQRGQPAARKESSWLSPQQSVFGLESPERRSYTDRTLSGLRNRGAGVYGGRFSDRQQPPLPQHQRPLLCKSPSEESESASSTGLSCAHLVLPLTRQRNYFFKSLDFCSDAPSAVAHHYAPSSYPTVLPHELELVVLEGESRVRARRSLPEGLSWGPYAGNIHSEPASLGQSETSPLVTLMLEDKRCWLSRLPLVSGEADANSVIYRKGELIWCKTTQAIEEKELLSTFVMAEPQGLPNHTVKSEPGDSTYPATLHSDIQLLPQQAGMAAILATAVVNKDVFPCKDCGIWYRSERNLQAHLMYYCASRQNPSSPSVDEKPKEAYPNERVCPFPQCKKSCPSASSLEIHMRSHSGERPFVCLICLSAFTTKANCERHLKVHTDTLNGICHSCGFISTTRDILYSHLVTNHMICQPGSKGEVYSPGPGLPAAKPLTPGPSQPSGTPILKCSLCGSVADSLASLRQHMVLHGPLPAVLGGAEPTPALAQPESPANAPAAKPCPADKLENGEARPPHTEGCPSALSSSGEVAPPLRIKEEPTDSPGGEAEAAKGNPLAEPAASPRSEPEASSRASSPHSLPSVKVKSEIASPTPGSSPVPGEPGVGTAGGNVFLPQYMFGHEATVVPQASEILAKMSELVHSRLKQGHGTAPPALYPSTPLPKGATCFECEITFNNNNNYYVHGAAPSPSSSPDADGPIDLSKKPRLHGEVLPASLLPLADYHECTACRISFNSLDSYLAHKKYYCPAMPLQAGTLEQLHKIKGAVPPPLKGRGSGAPENPDLPGEEPDGVRVKVEKAVSSVSPGVLVAKPLALPATYPCASGVDSLQRYASAKALHLSGAKVPLAVCPYCPLNGAVKGDLIEHFRNAHGLFGAKPGAGPGLPEAGWRKVPLGQIRAPGDQSIGDRLDPIQAEVQRQAKLKAAWDEVRAGWDEVQAAWEEVVTDTQVKATAWAPARFLQAPANTTQTLFHLPQILMHVAWLQARSAQIQASAAEAQLKALQVQGEDWLKDARKPAQAQVVSGPFLKQVYEQVAAAVHRILVLALQGLERAKQAQRLPVLSQLARAVHAQVEVALRGILAKAVRAVAAADRVELAEALCSQVEKAVQDVIVKAERDWGRPRGDAPGGSEGWGGAQTGGEAEL
ncbi:Zinc finger protein [Chelonia mydas]|uniref:Zinc finger protein ZFPM1 n=1 Tax=Chelonia mydas TaxID=8469 RepID=M7BKK5_CHEMY|nr:Zinc finger protein [Chelonia mydas]